MLVTCIAACSHIDKDLLNTAGNRSPLPATNGLIIELANGDHLGCRPGEEGFIALQQIFKQQWPGFHLVAKIPSNLDYRVASDSHKNGILRPVGDELSIANYKQILAGTLRDVPINI